MVVSTTETAAPATALLGLADALVRLSHAVQQVFADASRRQGLTPAQAQLLCRLTPGPVGMTELSRVLHLEKSSLTGLVDRVERRGLAARTPDPHDRRACQVELTRQGRWLAVACHEDVTRQLDRLADDLPVADRDRLGSLIGHVLAAYSPTGAPATGRPVSRS
jgi:DNA-binding MarR family transcriptional regulator